MGRKEVIVAVAVVVAVTLAMTSMAYAQSGRIGSPVPPPRSGGLGVDNGYPNAGLVIEGPRIPPVNVLFALQYDPVRRWVWAGTEASSLSAGQPDIYILDHLNQFQVLSTLMTDELRGLGATSAQIDGPVDEMTLLGNGDLLCADFNGDLTRFDDTLFLVDPSSPNVLKGVWYLDDMGCPGSCAANTNTNVPRDRVDYVAGLAVRHTNAITSTNQSTQEIFVSQYLVSAVIRQIELTPGTPGTWATRRTYTSPTADSVDGMDWDPDIQSFWMTCSNTSMIYEVALDTSINSFRVIQSFPSKGLGGAIAISALRNTMLPHAIVEGEGFSFSGSMHVLDTGHIGRGMPAVHDPQGTSTLQVGILMDLDCVGKTFRVLASGGAGSIPVGDRFLELAPDPILLWTLLDPIFTGTLDNNGAGFVTVPVLLPPNLGPLYFAVLVYDNPDENFMGIKRLSKTTAHVTQ